MKPSLRKKEKTLEILSLCCGLALALYCVYGLHVTLQLDHPKPGSVRLNQYSFDLSASLLSILISWCVLGAFYLRLQNLKSLYLQTSTQIMDEKRSFWLPLSYLLLKFNALLMPLVILQFFYLKDLFRPSVQLFLTVIFVVQLLLTIIVYSLASMQLLQDIKENTDEIATNH